MKRLVILQTLISSSTRCSSSKNYKFGTKQAYPLIDNISPLSKYLTNSSTVHAIFRHGYRFPKTSHMNRFQEAFPAHKFRWDKINDSMKLTKLGWQEHNRNGVIYKNFAGKAVIKSSHKSRSQDSARAFIQGTDLNLHYSINNRECRFWEECEAYETQSEMINKDKEIKKFRENFGISDQEEEGYMICAYELAIYGSSDFCEMIKRDLSYLSDLKHYYKTGFASKLNYAVTRPLLLAILDSIKTEQNMFWFGHAETTLPLIAALGLVKRNPPLSGDFIPDVYEWDTTKLAPMAANVVFIVDHERGGVVVAINEVVYKKFNSKSEFFTWFQRAIVDENELENMCKLPKSEL